MGGAGGREMRDEEKEEKGQMSTGNEGLMAELG